VPRRAQSRPASSLSMTSGTSSARCDVPSLQGLARPANGHRGFAAEATWARGGGFLTSLPPTLVAEPALSGAEGSPPLGWSSPPLLSMTDGWHVISAIWRPLPLAEARKDEACAFRCRRTESGSSGLDKRQPFFPAHVVDDLQHALTERLVLYLELLPQPGVVHQE